MLAGDDPLAWLAYWLRPRQAASTDGWASSACKNNGSSRRTLRLIREEPDQVPRLQAFRAAHPQVIIGDGGFGVWQARTTEPDGERIISRYTLREPQGQA